MTVKKFEFKQTYQEIEVAGKVYKVYFDDNQMKKYRDLYNKFNAVVKKTEGVNVEDLTNEQQDEYETEQRNTIKEFVDNTLGEGSFDELYEASGKSTYNMAELVYYIMQISEEYIGEKQEAKKDKHYLGK
ncbi:MAG: hypothetical protein ABTA16_00380 [Niallia sp.]